MSNKKIIFYTVIITFIIQIFFAWWAIAVFYYNYEKFSTSTSWISVKTNLNLKKINFNEIEFLKQKKKTTKENNILYKGILWDVEYFYKIDSKIWEFIEEKKYIFNINEKELKKLIIINKLNKELLLDKYILNYFLSLTTEFEEELINFLNFVILLDYNIEIEPFLNEINNDYNSHIISINKYVTEWKYNDLADILGVIENKYTSSLNEINEEVFSKNTILSDNRFQYVINKLYDKSYYSEITKVSNIFWIDKKLIISSVWVEQLRFLLSQRAYAKSLIKSNKVLTNFSKFSYWLWWIKLPTARTIQKWIKLYDKKIYNEYFKKDINLWDSSLISLLEEHFSWILYAWALISLTEKRWSDAWYSLKQKPWIIVTLYNMWNPIKKAPHNNPDMWGSILNINWNKLYFWEVWHLMYYYLTYYIEWQSNDKNIEQTKKDKKIKQLETIKEIILKNKIK